jgi:hypothetical protein
MKTSVLAITLALFSIAAAGAVEKKDRDKKKEPAIYTSGRTMGFDECVKHQLALGRKSGRAGEICRSEKQK